MRIAIIGDLHLGYRQYGLDEREIDFYKRWHEVIDDIISRKNIQIVLQLGDIFDTHIPSSIALYEYEKGLAKLQKANIEYYSITGNHTIIKRKNFMSPDDLFSKISESNSLDDTHIVIDDIFIAGIKYRSESNKEELLSAIKAQTEAANQYNGLKILLLHQGVDLDLIYGAELLENDLPYNDFDYIFIGHLHSRIERVHEKCHIIYPGSIERSSVTEAKDAINRGKGFYILDTDNQQCQWVNLPLSRDFLFIDIHDIEDIKNIKNEICKKDKKPIVNLSFQSIDIERAHEIGNIIANDCLRLNIVVENEDGLEQSDELLIDESISSIQNMLEQKMSKKQAIFAYDLLQIFNKNATTNDNILSAIELSDKYFEENY